MIRPFTILIVIAVLNLQAPSVLGAQDHEIKVDPPITSVIVYPQGAQLTHTGTVEVPEGQHVLIFSGLNQELNSSNTTVSLGGDLEILSVNHRNIRIRATQNADSIEVLEAEKSRLERLIRSVEIDREVNDYEMEMLAANREPDMQSGSALRDLLALHRERILELKTSSSQLADSIQSLRSSLNDINQALQQPGYQPTIMVGELLVEVNNPGAGTYDTEISYPIGRAGWTPEYELRAEGIDEELSSKFFGMVYNNSLQTWTDVLMTLSTRTPQRRTVTPELNPWFLDFLEPQVTLQERGRAEMDELVVTGYAESGSMSMPPPPRSFRSESMVARQFTLRDRQTIESGSERTRLTLEEYQVPSEFTYFSVPKLQEGAILKANIPDWEETFLMSGSAKLHLEGTYVGETYLNPQTVSDTLEVSFGRDSGIIVQRTKVRENSERSFFRNRITQTIAYDIEIRNTKGSAIELDLMDQIPVSVQEDIVVTPVNLSGGDLDEESGLVNWSLLLDPAETETLQLVYEVRY
ncbi:MAG: DUF4139 domain-containing protein, partial [Balneolaceae bacterium]|nr:DUF4139 domain-containing protein [Balneolaceae bacterium]